MRLRYSPRPYSRTFIGKFTTESKLNPNNQVNFTFIYAASLQQLSFFEYIRGTFHFSKHRYNLYTQRAMRREKSLSSADAARSLLLRIRGCSVYIIGHNLLSEYYTKGPVLVWERKESRAAYG